MLSIEKRIKLIIDLCNSIKKMHGMEIYHRDIKSSNILYDEEKGFFLCDFGIAFPAIEDSITTVERPGNRILLDKFRDDTEFKSRPNKYIYDIFLLGVFVWEVLLSSKWCDGKLGTCYDELDKDYNVSFFYSSERTAELNNSYINQLLTRSITSDEINIPRIEEFVASLSRITYNLEEDYYLLDDTFSYVFMDFIKLPYELYLDNDDKIEKSQYSFFEDNGMYAIKNIENKPWDTLEDRELVYSIDLFKISEHATYVKVEFILKNNTRNKKENKIRIFIEKSDDTGIIVTDLRKVINGLRT